MTLRMVLAAAASVSVLAAFDAHPAPPWGEYVHRLIAQRAVAGLPMVVPSFFRDAAEQLAYLNPEPERWRDSVEHRLDPAMAEAHAPEHYIHLEQVPPNTLRAPHRYAFLDSVRAAGLDATEVGLLPYQILELTQRIRVGFREWRRTADPRERAWIEARIVNDAGILGHYVADGANPHHTSMHYNGWVGKNPKEYTTDRTFHARFEVVYVGEHIKSADLQSAPRTPPAIRSDLRAEVLAFLRRSHERLERLYELEKLQPFGQEATAAGHKSFALERMAAGADMLRDLWWTAWVTSGGPAARPRNR